MREANDHTQVCVCDRSRRRAVPPHVAPGRRKPVAGTNPHSLTRWGTVLGIFNPSQHRRQAHGNHAQSPSSLDSFFAARRCHHHALLHTQKCLDTTEPFSLSKGSSAVLGSIECLVSPANTTTARYRDELQSNYPGCNFLRSGKGAGGRRVLLGGKRVSQRLVTGPTDAEVASASGDGLRSED
jgi:hypothetical protein